MRKIEAIRSYVIAIFLGVMGVVASMVFGSLILAIVTVTTTTAWTSKLLAVRRHGRR